MSSRTSPGDKMLVDAMTARMTLRPQTLDTIVATNLHADILSDLAAALAGSLGVAPTANLNPERKFPSMFEPIHGSAFDIMGRGVANPVGTLWSASMMLDHLGEGAAGARLMRAIERITAVPELHTPDRGGRTTTAMVTTAVIDAVRADNTRSRRREGLVWAEIAPTSLALEYPVAYQLATLAVATRNYSNYVTS